MNPRARLRSLLAALLLLVVLPAAAEDQGAVLTDLRREVADLRREISDLRREIYALRLDLLSAIGQAGAGSGSVNKSDGKTPAHAPVLERVEAPKDPAPKPAEEGNFGTVSGVVELKGDAKVAYVYVENVPARMAKNASIEIRQVGRQFEPRAAVVQVGTKINFPNLDSVYHNVFSTSTGNSFDLGIYRAGDPARSYTVVNPGVMDLYCDMHSEMSASVLVVPSALYVMVGADGRFILENVPKGSRKIGAWGPGYQMASQTVTVKPGAQNQVSLSLGLKSAAHTNKKGQPYGSYK
jgi:plastocyanin